jgi:hypothetical protein
LRGGRAFHVVFVAGAALATAGSVAAARPARADPQASVGLTLGGAVQNVVAPQPAGGALHLGGRGDVLLLRSRPGQAALGPYVDVATAGFHDFDLGAGAEALLPVTEDFPLVVSAGALARNGEGRTWAPGVEGTVFFGSRSYNFHSWYGLAIGLFAQSRWVPASPSTLDLVAGLQIDVQLLALPWIFAYEALTH